MNSAACRWPGMSAGPVPPGLVLALSLFLLSLWLVACSSGPPAPVEDRSRTRAQAEVPVDGLYRVRKGDSLIGIAFKYGLDYRDLARWNSLKSPDLIYVDQVLRLRPPTTQSAQSQQKPVPAAKPPATAVTQPTRAPTTPVAPAGSSAGAASRQAPASTQAGAPAAAAGTPSTKPSTTPVQAAPKPVAAMRGGWTWPVQGRIYRTFKEGDPTRNGLDIVVPVGTPVAAAASGVVVYSGNGLIGYGELIIIKHDERMLSAYAYNSRRLVAEGAQVTAGQQIAESGVNDHKETWLHFEIRQDGKPVNPMNYLPKQ